MSKETNENYDPYINIVENPATGKFTISLHQWNIEKDQEGYTEEEAYELIGLLERGIYHLNNCIEDYSEKVAKGNHEEKPKSKNCRGCSESIK